MLKTVAHCVGAVRRPHIYLEHFFKFILYLMCFAVEVKLSIIYTHTHALNLVLHKKTEKFVVRFVCENIL